MTHRLLNYDRRWKWVLTACSLLQSTQTAQLQPEFVTVSVCGEWREEEVGGGALFRSALSFGCGSLGGIQKMLFSDGLPPATWKKCQTGKAVMQAGGDTSVYVEHKTFKEQCPITPTVHSSIFYSLFWLKISFEVLRTCWYVLIMSTSPHNSGLEPNSVTHSQWYTHTHIMLCSVLSSLTFRTDKRTTGQREKRGGTAQVPSFSIQAAHNGGWKCKHKHTVNPSQ